MNYGKTKEVKFIQDSIIGLIFYVDLLLFEKESECDWEYSRVFFFEGVC
jgi:hypothetical protein